MKKNISLAIAVILVITLAILFKQHGLPEISTSNSLNVATSIFPIEEIVRNVGGNLVNLQTITPKGVEPHDYEPSPQDATTLQKAQLIIINGAGMEPWADKLASDLQKQGVTILNLVQTIPQAELIANSKGQIDPHIWQNPQLFQKEIEAVRDALIALDKKHSAAYTKNAAQYISEITALDQQFSEGLKSCTLNEFITAHNAFEYLALHNHLTARGIAGFSPDEEPSPRSIAELSTFARKQKIKYIFVEPLASSKLSETLAKESGAQILTLNPIEGLTGKEIANGATFVSLMKENLTQLRTALSCK